MPRCANALMPPMPPKQAIAREPPKLPSSLSSSCRDLLGKLLPPTLSLPLTLTPNSNPNVALPLTLTSTPNPNT